MREANNAAMSACAQTISDCGDTNERADVLGLSLRKLISDQGRIADLLSRGQRQ